MKTWTELQEWVEINASHHTKIIADFADHAIRTVVDKHVDLMFERPTFRELPEDEALAVRAALRWKTLEDLAERVEKTAEGWCEAYYRDLKRMYKEET